MRLRPALIALTLATTAAGLAVPAGATSTRHVVSATASVLSIPASSLPNENGEANAASCAGGTCTAVGFFGRSTAHASLAVLWKRSSSGVWGTGTMIGAPVGASATATSSLYSVSCSTSGTCLGIGIYKASSASPTQLLAVRELGGVVQRGVAISLPAGLHAPRPFAWCGAVHDCEVAGSAVNATGKGRIFTMYVTLNSVRNWYTPPTAQTYLSPSGLPTPNNGGSLSVNAFACVKLDDCIVVGALSWNSTTKTLPFSESDIYAVWGRVRVTPIPSDSVARSSVEFDASLSDVSCAGAGTSFAASHCVAVGTYDATEGSRQLVEKAVGGDFVLGTTFTLPNEGGFGAVTCRKANNVCVAAGYLLIEGEAGAGSLYSVGTWVGFSSVMRPPLATGGGDPFDTLVGGACLTGPTCVFVGQGVDNAANDPIEVTVSGLG